MRLLIATPAFGGRLCWNYVTSFANTAIHLNQKEIEFGFFALANESLIPRGRNRCASIALEDRFDKMIFIDADIGWKWSDLQALLQSDKLVVGGTYPVKGLPLRLNYNTLPEHRHLGKSIEGHRKLQSFADTKTGEIKVLHIPTGFMMIDVEVFRRLKAHVPSYTERLPHNDPFTDFDFFPVRIKDGRFESEDWAFCSLCQEHGIDIYLNTSIILNHLGRYVYKMNPA